MNTEESIKVSVLMLAYNQQEYIDEAIRSVVLQRTAFAFELIVADDASSDATPEHIARWQQRYPDIVRVLPRQANLGLARNFIRAYREARGEYIAICEGDDFWTDSRKLQRQADFMDSHKEYAMCFHRVVNYYQADGSKSLSNGGQRRTVSIRELAMCNPITNVAVFYRHALVPELPEWMPEVTSYDFVMHMLCARHGDIYYMRRPMAVYRKLATSIWTGGDQARRSMISLRNRDLLIGYFESRDAEVCRLLRTANAQKLLELSLYYAAQGDPDKEQQALRDIARYRPDWTREDLSRELARMQTATHAPSLLRRMLTALRRTVSRLLPLPRVRG